MIEVKPIDKLRVDGQFIVDYEFFIRVPVRLYDGKDYVSFPLDGYRLEKRYNGNARLVSNRNYITVCYQIKIPIEEINRYAFIGVEDTYVIRPDDLKSVLRWGVGYYTSRYQIVKMAVSRDGDDGFIVIVSKHKSRSKGSSLKLSLLEKTSEGKWLYVGNELAVCGDKIVSYPVSF